MTVAAPSLQNPQADAAAAINGKAASGSKSSVQDMQDRFLTLLVTQLKNQDPMNPMDNAELTMQLAQMSTVEGISKLNSSMASMLQQSQSAQVMQGASLIGRQVLATGDQLTLGTAGAAAGVDLNSAADKVEISIHDSNGNLVRSLQLGQLDAGLSRFAWDGKDNAGVAQAAGDYTFKVKATAETEAIEATSYSLASVLSVSLLDGSLNIEVNGLGDRSMNQIKQIF